METYDPLAAYRKTPPAPAGVMTPPQVGAEYIAYGTKDKVRRLRIRPSTTATHSPGYNLLLDISYDGDHGTNIMLVFTVMMVMVQGKNPSFSLYTQIALATADRIILPVMADDSSRRAIQNAMSLIYGLKLPSEIYASYAFATKLKAENRPLPKVHLIAKNRITQYMGSSNLSTSTLFERRVSDAFKCLGFEVRELGQGTGRKTDSIAAAPKERFALIIDAKVRTNGYKLGTEDRKFLEYAVNHGKQLQSQGFDKIYFVVVAPSFRDADLKQLAEYLSDSPIRGISMITARALMRMVEESIRNRSQFSLSEFSKQMFGNKIIPD